MLTLGIVLGVYPSVSADDCILFLLGTITCSRIADTLYAVLCVYTWYVVDGIRGNSK